MDASGANLGSGSMLKMVKATEGAGVLKGHIGSNRSLPEISKLETFFYIRNFATLA